MGNEFGVWKNLHVLCDVFKNKHGDEEVAYPISI